MNNWKPVAIVIEGEPVIVDGVNLWSKQWVKLNCPSIQLPHPSYPNQFHQMSVFQIEENEKNIIFAANELSANVWGFYVPV
ncbi:MAG: hypothetical protein ACXWJK_13705 [Burkholderiaceae bacterium]